MRLRLGLALLLTICLIGTATWIRLGKPIHSPLANAVLYQAAPDPTEVVAKNPTETVTDLNTTGSTTPGSENLSQTDLIGRQLLTDYMNLSAQGQATPDNLTALAGSYADNIATLDSAPSIASADLKVVPDSPATLQTYADNLAAVYLKYQQLMDGEFGNGKDLSTLGPDFASFATDMQGLYQREANEFKTLPVPTSILENEVKLINIYLSDAAIFQALANVAKDPASAFSGVVLQQQNNSAEKAILSDIGKILDVNGIIPRTP